MHVHVHVHVCVRVRVVHVCTYVCDWRLWSSVFFIGSLLHLTTLVASVKQPLQVVSCALVDLVEDIPKAGLRQAATQSNQSPLITQVIT